MSEQSRHILEDLTAENNTFVKTIYLVDTEIQFILKLLEECEQRGVSWGEPKQFEKQRSLLKRKLEAIE